MGTLTPATRQLGSRLAGVVSAGTSTPQAVADLRRDFRAAAAADTLQAELAKAPALTRSQYDRLHELIRRHQLTGGAR